MKIYCKPLNCAGSALFLTACLTSANAVAGLTNLQLTIKLNDTTERLMPNPTRCSSGVAGVTTGTGDMKIATNSGKKAVTIPVAIVATDCPDTQFNFNNGKFELISLQNNADKLTASYHGSFSGSLPDPITNIVTLRMNGGAFAITGGTGIFNGASGSGQLQGAVKTAILDFATLIYNQIPISGNLDANGRVSFAKEEFQQKYDFFATE